MENKRLLIIANPRSGKAKIKNDLLKIVEVFSDVGYEVTVYPTKSRGDATYRAELIQENEFDLVVVCGGDGTLNEVITGVMKSGINVKFGYIPLGTLNEWSSSLSISRNAVQAAKDIVSGKEIRLDIGKFNDRYFTYTASFGAFTEASYSTPQSVKNVLGQSAYFFEGIKSITNIKPVHLQIECDGSKIEGDYIFGAISNSMSVGGIVKFDDRLIKLNDGEFEVLLIKKPSNLIELNSILDGILSKNLTKDGIKFLHGKEIKVIGGKDVNWTLDGEYAEGSHTVTLTNISSALRLFVPEVATRLDTIINEETD